MSRKTDMHRLCVGDGPVYYTRNEDDVIPRDKCVARVRKHWTDESEYKWTHSRNMKQSDDIVCSLLCILWQMHSNVTTR